MTKKSKSEEIPQLYPSPLHGGGWVTAEQWDKDSDIAAELEANDKAKTADPTNPAHYATQFNDIEVIQLTEQLNFNRGNAVKYTARAGAKDPDKEIEDLEKARWYIDREITRLKTNAERKDK